MAATKQHRLRKSLHDMLENAGITLTVNDEKFIPRKWEIFTDMVLLPAEAFVGGIWTCIEQDELWRCVAEGLKVNRVARYGKIQPDAFRSPCVEMLLGKDTWARKKENGLIYELDVSKSMFSSGNITEKTRMMKLDCEGDIVVDLFAGIGYFTIPLLAAGAGEVYACEWNPYAVEALRRNLIANKVEERCEILFGDNRQVAPVGVADRVILGLIPSSEISWLTAVKCLKPSHGGILHIHMNVETLEKNEKNDANCPVGDIRNDFYLSPDIDWKKSLIFRDFAFEIMRKLSDGCRELYGENWRFGVSGFERVKSYGPKIWHCVYDVDLRPPHYSSFH